MHTGTRLTDAEFEALYGGGASAMDMNMDFDLRRRGCEQPSCGASSSPLLCSQRDSSPA